MTSTVHPRTPVLVGLAQVVDRDSPPESARSPLALLEQVARAAIADSGAKSAVSPDVVAVVRTFADSGGMFKPPFYTYRNLPGALAKALGASPQRCIYPVVGGNTPQWLVNVLAEDIAQGRANVALIAGAEAIRTQARAQKAGLSPAWLEDMETDPEVLGKDLPGVTKHELTHGVALPVNVYPLFENALGHHYGRDPKAHRAALGALMAPFTQVAAANPYAALPVARTAAELSEPSDDNRIIAYPYTKYFNSNMFVDQAAAVLLMASETADALGVPADKRVYLHGCADTVEKWHVTQRVNYHSSPAIRVGARVALAQAGIAPADLGVIDLYSCFPVAVEIAADEIGLAHDDPRGLTATGGLPYFGGPGNNYTLHGIAEVAQRLRGKPGAFGLATGNGYYLTKHSFGVYSTTPTKGAWQRIDPATYQSEIDAMEAPRLEEQPNGAGTVEAFTVVYDKGLPLLGVVIGRLAADGARFLATVREPAQVAQMIDQPVIGRAIQVSAGDPQNVAVFA
jgi:acetyl-CoA C-acetyltransferase